MQRIKLEDKKITRGASLLLCCAMMFSPMRAVAFSGNVPVEGGGLCAHHPEHTAACGYYDLIEGTACTHEHSEECYTDIQACIHEHTAGCAGVTEASNTAEVPSGAAGDMTDGDAQPAACTHTCSEETGCVTETLNCAHEAGEHDGDCDYTAGAPAGVCRYACAVCPIQARIDALPGPDAIAAMDEAAWEALWQEIESLNEAIGALAEADKASLDPSKLTAISAALTADEKHVIDRDSATLKGWGWMIEKDSENHFTLRIPGVTEGTPLPFTNPGNDAASFTGIFGGINFTANSGNINIFSSEKGPTLDANQSGNFAELQAVADANGGKLPVGKYDMEFKLSKLGGTVNGAFPDTKKEDFIFENGDDFFTLTVILGTEPGDDTPFDQYTIQTVSPSNVNFTLFDYWIYKQTTHDHPNDGKKTVSVIPTCGNPACIGENKHVTPDKDKDGDIIDDSRAESFFSAGINQDHALVFGPTGSRDDENDTLGDWNSPTGTGGAVQGIVANKLNEEGYPVLDLDPAEVRQKKFINGRDENESLKYLFSLEENDFKSVYENANGLLKIDPETGNYKYNSLENFASYFEEERSFKVYEKPAVKAGANERGQFFPFNQPSQVFAIEDGELKEKQMREFSGSEFTTTPHLPDGGIDAFFNHYFGMTMEVKFQQPPKGKISNAANAKDMIFTFAGDDDVWIFIDGVLVADLGGIHDAMGVEINFATGEIKIDRKDRFNNQNAGPTRVNSTIKKQFKTAGVNTAAGFNGDTFGDNTVHELKMFYIERGNFASNLDISFNLMEPEFSHIVKVDQKGDGLSGVEFKLYEATDKFEVAEDAVALATLVTGEGGTVDFVTYDEADKPIPIAFKPDQNYVLREVKTRDGFVTTGDIHLSYTEDTGLLEVKNQWNTGATAGFEARVTQPGNLKFANGDDASIKGQEGLVLAVPMLNPIHKGSQEKYGWRPLYGSVTEGFHMVEVESEDAEGYRSAALQAALLQLDNPRNERWYLE